MRNEAVDIFPSAYDRSWNAFLENERFSIAGISKQLGQNYTPAPKNVLRFATLPLKSLKVVILGQDPYPANGVATGRAFEVGGLFSWRTPFRQVSFKNIVRALYGASGGDPYTPYSEVLHAVEQGKFNLPTPDSLFPLWEEQGVLLLNTAFTTPIGTPGGHSELWRGFSERLIGFISQNRPDLFWFLWGAHAQSFQPFIGNGIKFVSRHPMMCSSKWDDDFLKNPCFAQIAHLIKWNG